MGVSTDAILFYGYCWDEEDMSNPWEIGREDADGDEASDEDADVSGCSMSWETRYARARGCLPPDVPYPERTVTPTRENNYSSTPTDYSAAELAVIARHTAYWEAKDAIVEASQCAVRIHCMDSCPMAYVTVKVSVTTSRRGFPCEITSLTAPSAWTSQLAEFCAALGIETGSMKAAWWMVSYWSD